MASPTREMTLSTLFGGTKFWLSHHIPQRTRLKEMIEEHGGIIVLLEKFANVKLVDHTKKNLPADSYSYQYVERSVRNGKLEDLEKHRAGSSVQRPVGASHIPKKGTRSEYSLNDDQLLFDWLYPYEQMGNAPVNGNNIYKGLAERFPQHTWQSWRARYIKFLRGKPRPGGGEPRPEFLEPVSLSVPMPMPPAPANPTPPMTAKPVSSTTEKPVPDPSPSRIPTVTKPSQPSKTPQSRPNGSGESKRKRDSLTESSANRRSETGPLSPKRVLLGTSEAMDSLVYDLSRPSRPRTRRSSSRQTTRKSPNKPSLSPEILSGATKPSQPAITQKPAQNEPTKLQDPSHDSPDPLFLELPFLPSSPEPEVEETDQESNLDVNDWIDAQLERGNVELPIVLQALQCTSMNPESAERVLEYCAAGKEVPSDMPGVWTPEDDRCLEGQDARAIKSVCEKHGDDFVNARWEYLSLARGGGII